MLLEEPTFAQGFLNQFPCDKINIMLSFDLWPVPQTFFKQKLQGHKRTAKFESISHKNWENSKMMVNYDEKQRYGSGLRSALF